VMAASFSAPLRQSRSAHATVALLIMAHVAGEESDWSTRVVCTAFSCWPVHQ
jgi:hypothetical protein